MLELVPSGLTGRRFSIERAGQPIAELALSWLREGGEVTIAGAPFQLERQGLLRGEYRLRQMGQDVVTARRSSALRDRYELTTADGRMFELAKTSWWGSAFSLREHGQEVGSVRRHHPFTRRAAIAMPEDLAPPVAVFAVALVVLTWNRNEAAAAG